MMRWSMRGILLAGVIAAVIWGWIWFFPSPEHAIRRRLNDLASLACVHPNEGAAASVFSGTKLLSYFAPEIRFIVELPGHPRQEFNDRGELLAAAVRFRSLVGTLQVDFLDINVSVAPDKQSATAHLTVRAKVGGENDLMVQELRFKLRKIDGTWLISEVETVKTLS